MLKIGAAIKSIFSGMCLKLDTSSDLWQTGDTHACWHNLLLISVHQTAITSNERYCIINLPLISFFPWIPEPKQFIYRVNIQIPLHSYMQTDSDILHDWISAGGLTLKQQLALIWNERQQQKVKESQRKQQSIQRPQMRPHRSLWWLPMSGRCVNSCFTMAPSSGLPT